MKLHLDLVKPLDFPTALFYCYDEVALRPVSVTQSWGGLRFAGRCTSLRSVIRYSRTCCRSTFDLRPW
eukprot:2168866-Amphidinium_carterae.1